MHRTWDAPGVTRALAALKDNGISIRDMTKMSGANRSTIYRWMSGGDGQPDYDLVNRLAAGVWRRHPDLARELVEASGYAWAEPAAEPEPPPIPPEVLAVIRKNYPPDQQREVIEMLESLSGPPGTEPSQSDAPDSRRAG